VVSVSFIATEDTEKAEEWDIFQNRFPGIYIAAFATTPIPTGSRYAAMKWKFILARLLQTGSRYAACLNRFA